MRRAQVVGVEVLAPLADWLHGWTPIYDPVTRMVSGVASRAESTYPLGPTTIAMERGHGAHQFAVDALALVRGMIDTLVNELELRLPLYPQRDVLEVHSSTWAGIVGKHFAQPFPAASKDRKKHSIKLAERQLGFKLKVSEDDIADAVNIALAVTKTGKVR